jgi:hypothetical protein
MRLGLRRPAIHRTPQPLMLPNSSNTAMQRACLFRLCRNELEMTRRHARSRNTAGPRSADKLLVRTDEHKIFHSVHGKF